MEIHRFPSLNSVGRIRVGVSVDDGPVMTVESFSNDEWRGEWKNNVLNNVDRLYRKLPPLKSGEHRILIWAIDRYFAFSRIVIYTKPRKKNNLAGLGGTQPLPKEWNLKAWCDAFYGTYELPPRPVFYTVGKEQEDSLAPACRVVQPAHYGQSVKPEWYLSRGSRMFEEHDGTIKIDAASVLAESDFAWTQKPFPESIPASIPAPEKGGRTPDCQECQEGLWRYCAGESFGRSGLAMYIRKPGLSWEAPDAPSLNYRILCTGGTYTVWMLSKFNVREESFFALAVDGQTVSREKLFGEGSLWRYETEQIYRWVPVSGISLETGEHVLRIYALSSGMRYDRFYLTKGKELPPEDTGWQIGEIRSIQENGKICKSTKRV